MRSAGDFASASRITLASAFGTPMAERSGGGCVEMRETRETTLSCSVEGKGGAPARQANSVAPRP
jgi:hypothetical protein